MKNKIFFVSALLFAVPMMVGGDKGLTLQFAKTEQSSNLPSKLKSVECLTYTSENDLYEALKEKYNGIEGLTVHRGRLEKYDPGSQYSHAGIHVGITVGTRHGELLKSNVYVKISDFANKVTQILPSPESNDSGFFALVGRNENIFHAITCSNLNDFMTEFHKAEVETTADDTQIPECDLAKNKSIQGNSAQRILPNAVPKAPTSGPVFHIGKSWLMGGGVLVVLAGLIIYFDGIAKIKQMAGY